MTLTKTLCVGMAVASLLWAGSALAQDAITAPAQKAIGAHTPQMIPSLAVINSGSATLSGGKLTLTNVTPNAVVFADRPVRAAGHVLTTEFIKEWDEGVESFAKDPPNATLSVLSADGKAVEDAVVVLKSPKIEGQNLTFDVDILEGSIANATGPASLFIDWYAGHWGGGGGHGWVAGGRGPAWHGAWYGHGWAPYGVGLATGAVIGAAAATAAAPYYYPPPPPPACGYYPYPPCY